jgi:hypothetical protein
MRKNLFRNIALLFFIAILVLPSFASAIWTPDKPLVPPCTQEEKDAEGKVIAKTCGFNDFIRLIANFIDFLLFYFSMPLAAILFAFAGFKLLTSGGNEAAMTSAKGLIWNVIIGLVVALSAWLIVKGILSLAPGFSLLG